MYLTKFPLNMTRRETHRMLASPYRLHAALEGSVPRIENSSGGGRLLWRVDREKEGSANLYIVSPVAPSLVGLDEQIGWPDLKQQWQTRSYDGFLSKLDVGQMYGFRLYANPVVSRSAIKDAHGRSKRVSHLTALQQMSWLVGAAAYEGAGMEIPEWIGTGVETRAERNGFEVVKDNSGSLQLVISDIAKREFIQGAKGRVITLATARYDGVLRITNADCMRHALSYGIGHGKGFGCGLMTLAAVGAE